MAEDIRSFGKGGTGEKTVVDPNSPLHRAGAADSDKTQIDPNALKHRQQAAAAADSDKTQIDPNALKHRQQAAAPAPAVDIEKTRMLLQDVGRMLVAEGAPVEKTRMLLGSVHKLVASNTAAAGDSDKTQALLGDVRAMLVKEGVTLDNEKTRMLLNGIAGLLAPRPTDTDKTVANPATTSAGLPKIAPPDQRTKTRPPAAPSVALPVGYRLFEYRIDALLGQGGFGITYLATDVNLNSKVAIKEYLPEDIAYRSTDDSVSAKNPEDQDFYDHGLEAFLVEARTLATFRHRNIVRVARFFEANSTAYMVLEYERGKSLKAWWQEKKSIPERDVLTLFLPLLDGLGAVHDAGYLHRDIKPDNIYVRDEDGSLVLLDFGAARQAKGSADDTNIVTPGYGPIEQYFSGDQGPWTDIYAFGATLYWMIAGKKPIEAPQRMAEPDPLPSATEIGKGKFSPEFLKAVDWALKPEAKDRPKDMPQFLEGLFAANAGTLGLAQALRSGDDATVGGDSWLAALKSPALLKGRLTRLMRMLTRPGSWPLAVKMTLAMVATALAPMLITAYYNFSGSVERVSKSELANLEQLSASLAGRVSQLITDSKNLAAFLASDDDFVKFLASPRDEDKIALKSKLDGLVKSNPDVQLAMVFDTAGTAVVSSDPQVMGKNFKFREYFKVAMEGKPFISGIIVGAVAGAAGVFYSIPVYALDGKQVIGAVVLRIKADAIARILDAAKQGNERIPFLVDDDGVIIHHPNEKLLYMSLVPLSKTQMDEIKADQRFRRDKIDDLRMPGLAKAMVGTKQPGSVGYFSTVSGKEEIAGYAPVQGHNWAVGVTESREYFEAPLNELFQTVLYSVVIIGAVFVLLALLFARTIVRPIEELTSAAHALKAGDYDKAAVAVKSNDEIGQLARTFNVMIDVLRQRERERGSLGRRGGSQKS
jgi:serine/threonine protein kinase/HAMP domain-containing protein